MTTINYGPIVTLGDESGPHRADCNRIMHRSKDLPCNCDRGIGGSMSSGAAQHQAESIPQYAQNMQPGLAPHPIDLIRHPPHYNSHPSGIECLTITRHMNFCTGNVIKYLWRAGLKNSASKLEDLEKALFYLEDEIKRVKEELARGEKK